MLMRFHMSPVIYEDDLQVALVETYDREIDLRDAFNPEADNVIFVGITGRDIEEDAYRAEIHHDTEAPARNMIRYLLKQYMPVGTDEVIIALDY